MYIDEMHKSINDARAVIARANRVFVRVSSMLVGNLRHCNTYDLQRMKTELRDFNATTCEWKEPGAK